jgi:hypothetical protein
VLEKFERAQEVVGNVESIFLVRTRSMPVNQRAAVM